MSLEVVLTRHAEQQLYEATAWYQQEAPQFADAWFNGFVAAIAALEEFPLRCGLAPESESFPFELRQLLYGLGRRYTHRALFVVHPHRVVVHAIRHLSQRELTADDLA